MFYEVPLNEIGDNWDFETYDYKIAYDKDYYFEDEITKEIYAPWLNGAGGIALTKRKTDELPFALFKRLKWQPPKIQLKVNNSKKEYDNGCVKIDESLREIDKIWTKVNGSLREV